MWHTKFYFILYKVLLRNYLWRRTKRIFQTLFISQQGHNILKNIAIDVCTKCFRKSIWMKPLSQILNLFPAQWRQVLGHLQSTLAWNVCVGEIEVLKGRKYRNKVVFTQRQTEACRFHVGSWDRTRLHWLKDHIKWLIERQIFYKSRGKLSINKIQVEYCKRKHNWTAEFRDDHKAMLHVSR